MRTSIVISPALVGISRRNAPCRTTGRTFDPKKYLCPDLLRVYKALVEKNDNNEDYALTVIFTVRTAIELHRAWHVTLLTSMLLQQIKDKFGLKMTWSLGVTDLAFRFEDGLYEIHRRVPYDYDSEFQNMYEKIAVALIEDEIGIHDALLFQMEMKRGDHTCESGKFLRKFPGRLVLYPLQAATCCVIFFGGDWRDAGVASLCGLMAGLIEWGLSSDQVFANVKDSKLLIDFFIGLSTGIIGGLFYEYSTDQYDFCLQGVFLGTLYWFFYGTAFVIGLLEIIAGELQTGVTRFLAVMVKTFVLSVSSAAGLTLVVQSDVYDDWSSQFQSNSQSCGTTDLENQWWRLPLYILCSISVLGQYRFIISDYILGLMVQVAAYECQYRIFQYYDPLHRYDGMDTVFSDLAGSAAAVFTASLLGYFIDRIRHHFRLTITQQISEKNNLSTCGRITKGSYEFLTRVGECLGLGRGVTRRANKALKKVEDNIPLTEDEERNLVEAAIEAQEFNVWSLLMPAVYQLVPGSKIAQVWYNLIFPPSGFDNLTRNQAESAEISLWLTSVSLALGLILGLTIVRLFAFVICKVVLLCHQGSDEEIQAMKLRISREYNRKMVTHQSEDNDPDDGYDWAKEFDQMYGDRTNAANGTTVESNPTFEMNV